MKVQLLSLFMLTTTLLFSQYTYVPDDNFEQALIDQGLDDVLDDYVLSANIYGISSLSITNKNINDLTGIEGFVSLSQLHCQYNNLTTLDLSQNNNLMIVYAFTNNLTQIDISASPNLIQLDVSHNQLATIDISANTLLEEFCCYDNLFSNLDVSNNTQLYCFECWQNSLTSIDVSNNTELFNFSCSENQITSIDLSNNLLLENLLCFDNDISSLDVSSNIYLKILKCYETQIESLDLTNNTLLFIVSCGYNDALQFLDLRNGNNTYLSYYNSNATPNLQCIFVDDAVYCENNWWNVDPASTFVETQAECDNLNLIEFENESFVIIPNPADTYFRLQSTNQILTVSIYNILGDLVAKYVKQEFYDLSSFSKGIYMVKAQSNKGIQTRKLLIE